jgi:hypothetical protein
VSAALPPLVGDGPDAPMSDCVLSSRVRLARNLIGFNFVNRSTHDQLSDIVHHVQSARLGGPFEAGTRWVAEAGPTIGDLVQRVQEVAGLIDSISASAEQQTQGFAQMNASVSELDSATQQNAALVEEAASAAGRNRITSALTGSPLDQMRIDETVGPVACRAGDRWVLASDGLDTLSMTEIAALLAASQTAQTAADELVAAVEAAERPGQDNTTVVVWYP